MILDDGARNVGEPSVRVMHDGGTASAVQAGGGKIADDKLEGAVGESDGEEDGDVDEGGEDADRHHGGSAGAAGARARRAQRARRRERE